MRPNLILLTLLCPLSLTVAQVRVAAKSGENTLQVQIINRTSVSHPSMDIRFAGDKPSWLTAGSSVATSIESYSSGKRGTRIKLPFNVASSSVTDATVTIELTTPNGPIGSVPIRLSFAGPQGTVSSSLNESADGTLKKGIPGDQVVDEVQANEVVLPTIYALRQNYPNPFNPETIIEYDLPEAASVVLTVYDLLGRHVKTLVEGSYDAGTHRVAWNGRDKLGERVAAGMYLYMLSAGDKRFSGKMILLP